MKRVYMDNGATSFPKAPGVGDAIKNYIENVGVNVGRGAYSDAFDAQRIVLECRDLIKSLADAPETDEVIFTQNITQSINTVIKGLLNADDHVLISSMEHNAIMRPLHALKDIGVTYDMVPCRPDGTLILESVETLITPQTKAIIMTHASNVSGTILDLESIGKIASAHHLYFIIDAAQTFGAIPLSKKTLNADVFCFTGHKALLGPQGMGGFILSPKVANEIRPLIEGGTGSLSDTIVQPTFLPDKFESGTPNLPGIYGLHAALKYIESIGVGTIHQHEVLCTEAFLNQLKQISEAKVVGLPGTENRTAVVSLDFYPLDNAEIAFQLDKKFGIQTRVGMHCAPMAHQTLQSYPQGTIRFSFSSFTQLEEIEYAINAIRSVLEAYDA